MTVKTESGSVYELTDTHARRVSGPGQPTPRFSPEGEWKELAAVLPLHPEIGKPLLFVWPDGGGTRTNLVTEVIE